MLVVGHNSGVCDSDWILCVRAQPTESACG